MTHFRGQWKRGGVKKEKKSLWKLPGPGETKSFPTAISSGFTRRVPPIPAPLRPKFTREPAPSSLRQKTPGVRDGPGVGWCGGGPSDRVLSVSISPCPVVAMPFFPRAGLYPGPRPLWGQLKDPWHGRATTPPTGAARVAVGKVSPSRHTPSAYLQRPWFRCVWFSSRLKGVWVQGTCSVGFMATSRKGA